MKVKIVRIIFRVFSKQYLVLQTRKQNNWEFYFWFGLERDNNDLQMIQGDRRSKKNTN